MEINPQYLNGSSVGKSITARGLSGVVAKVAHTNGATAVTLYRDDNGKLERVLCFWHKAVDIRSTITKENRNSV